MAATYNSVTLHWRPGFNGGFPQVNIDRPKDDGDGDGDGDHDDDSNAMVTCSVFPRSPAEAVNHQLPLCRRLSPQRIGVHGNHHHCDHHYNHNDYHYNHYDQVGELQMDTGYTFAVMAFNKLGESGYSAEVQGNTASENKIILMVKMMTIMIFFYLCTVEKTS